VNTPKSAAPAVSAPTLGAINPNQGPASGGTSVTLTGTALTTATSVKFGSTAASTFTVLSDTGVVAVAPAGSGAVQVTVVTSGGTSNGLTFTYRAVPTLSSVAPNQGSVVGGTSVALTGAHFVSATAVKFGGVAATSFTGVSDTQITATAPPGTAGPVVVTVTSVGGTSTDTVYFYYVAVPTLTGAMPNQGPVAGGTSVTLAGSHFTTATAVKFGSVAASSFTVVSDTQITATAPPGTAGAVNVTVTTVGGTSNTATFTYLPAPTLTSAVPNQGPTSGGTSVTLTGTQLTTATAVMFGSTAATSFTVVSDSTMVAVAPPGTGTVQVTVTATGGTSDGLPYTAVGSPGI
jgi:hypothetical protein